jgi:hypothetical protein
MAADSPACPELDVPGYPPHMLHVDEARITIGARYRQTWTDGFGARGWKLNSTLGDPEIIASTHETGSAIPTSVLVHDILDHLLSGFAPSGHRAEAVFTGTGRIGRLHRVFLRSVTSCIRPRARCVSLAHDHRTN